MTVAPGRAPESEEALPDEGLSGHRGRAAERAVAVTRSICPYLGTLDGSWVSAEPSRDHRCLAVAPPALPAPDKQRRVCLGDGHGACATFIAARELHRAASDARPTAPWHFSRPTPVVLDHGHSPAAIVARARARSIGQIVLVGLMAVAFATVVVARFPTVEPSAAVANITASATAAPSVAPASPSPAPVQASPSPSPAPASASPSPQPAVEVYRVRSGDTLLAIAERYGTTVKAIMELNAIEDAKLIRVGQRLEIPS